MAQPGGSIYPNISRPIQPLEQSVQEPAPTSAKPIKTFPLSGEFAQDQAQGTSNNQYTVGWICALTCELAAARAMLDYVEENGPEQDQCDHNVYIFGRLGGHKVVIACLPGSYGTNSAAIIARDLSRSFKSIRIGLMVGIGGGAPSSRNDIRLGDIVISQPERTLGGVVQYDLGKTLADGKLHRVGALNAPPRVLMAAVTQLKAKYLIEDSQVPQFLSEMIANKPR